MFLDQPVFALLPLVFFYYLCPIYIGYYIGRCSKSASNIILPLVVIGLFYILKPSAVGNLNYIMTIIVPVIFLQLTGYVFGSIKKRHFIKRELPYIIGITGLPCSGKSEASTIFGKLGAKVLDIDKLGHTCLADKDLIVELAETFGEEILTDKGEVDRGELGKLVFNDPKNLKKLEQIIHPEMISKVEETIRYLEPEAVLVLDAAILQHMGLDKICNRVFVTSSDTSTRISRASERGWDIDELFRRDEAVKKDLSYRDITMIENNNSKEQFIKNIESIWKEIRDER